MEGAVGDMEAEEQMLQQAIKQLNKRLLPLFLAVVCCCYLDRTAVAFAALQMCALPWFSPALFGLGSGIFYLVCRGVVRATGIFFCVCNVRLLYFLWCF